MIPPIPIPTLTLPKFTVSIPLKLSIPCPLD